MLLTAGGLTPEPGDFVIMKIRDPRAVLPATLMEEGLPLTNWTVNKAYGLCCVAQCLTCLYNVHLGSRGKGHLRRQQCPIWSKFERFKTSLAIY